MKRPTRVDALPQSYRGREQTFVKHLILKRYLERVARIILWSQSDFVFVDGFSGPWGSRSSTYEDTSFGIAMRLLRRVRDELHSTHKKKRRVRCIFVERHRAAFSKLQAAVNGVSYIEAQAIQGRFEDKIDDVLREVDKAFVLVSIDPKGWTFDLRKMGPLLRHRPSEVIVNFMFEHINRFLDDRRGNIRASYGLPFGDPNWRARFDALIASGLAREEAVLELFREQLKDVGEYQYVASARVQRATADRSHFYLVYGTRNRKGLVEFRKVEKKAIEAEESARTEAKQDKRVARTGQHELPILATRTTDELRNPELDKARGWLIASLRSADRQSYDRLMTSVLQRFSITETEFKTLSLQSQKEDQITISGMRTGQQKPDDGCVFSIAST